MKKPPPSVSPPPKKKPSLPPPPAKKKKPLPVLGREAPTQQPKPKPAANPHTVTMPAGKVSAEAGAVIRAIGGTCPVKPMAKGKVEFGYFALLREGRTETYSLSVKGATRLLKLTNSDVPVVEVLQ